MSYQSLLPVFAKTVLDVDSSGLGFLMGAIGVGALAGTLGIASFGNFQRKGLLMLALLLIFGAALNLFALSTTLYLSLAALTVVGMGSQGYMALNNTLILTHTKPPDEGTGDEHLYDELGDDAPWRVARQRHRRCSGCTGSSQHGGRHAHTEHLGGGSVQAPGPSTGLAGCRKTLTTIPLAPFLARKGEEKDIVSEGHPQTPGKGASPLCTPYY